MNIIGKPFTRADAAQKAAGAEKYAADWYGDDLLWAGVRRSGLAHGRIISVDVSETMKLPGVFAVLTGRDVSGSNRQGMLHKDFPVLACDKVRYCGDAVALVLAEDRETLRRAISLVKVDIEPLPAVFSIDDALKLDAPLVHEDHPGGNVLLKAEIRKGDAEEAFKDCDVIIEETFEVPMQAHAFLETENGVAWLESDGRIVLVASTQAPFRDRWEVSEALGLPMDKIRVIGPYLGGGFGGKDGATIQSLLVLAALHAGGRRVKMWWDRQENFAAGYKRHSARLNYRLGSDFNGALKALHGRLYYNTGAYAHLGGEVMALGMEHAGGPYNIPDTLIEGWCVYTNNPIAGAMRGFGVVQVSFAIESMMDILATRLGMDPLELRMKNALSKGDINTSGVVMTQSTGIKGCIAALQNNRAWIERKAWKEGAGTFKKRGVGVSAVFNAMGYGRGLPDSSIAKIELTAEGNLKIFSGVSDMGQGNSTAYVQIAAEILNQDISMIELVQPDTDKSLPSGSSSASRTTYTYGNALIKACEDLRYRITGHAALMLMTDIVTDLELLPGRVCNKSTGKEITLKAISATMAQEERICTSQFIMPVVKDRPDTGHDFVIGFPHLLFSYSAHLACIEIDELTGSVEIKSYAAATEAGRIINPETFNQQVQGAIAQGVGYALHEEIVMRDGRLMTPDFSTYIIPGSLDVPEIDSLSVEDYEETGPFGLKGVGEVAASGPLPAIANALADACGVRMTRSPLNPESVLMAMMGKKPHLKGDVP